MSDEFAELAVVRINALLEDLAPLAAKQLPRSGMERRLRLAKLRNAGIEIAALAHWALRPSRRRGLGMSTLPDLGDQ